MLLGQLERPVRLELRARLEQMEQRVLRAKVFPIKRATRACSLQPTAVLLVGPMWILRLPLYGPTPILTVSLLQSSLNAETERCLEIQFCRVEHRLNTPHELYDTTPVMVQLYFIRRS